MRRLGHFAGNSEAGPHNSLGFMNSCDEAVPIAECRSCWHADMHVAVQDETQNGITVFMGVPTMYSYLLSAYDGMTTAEQARARSSAPTRLPHWIAVFIADGWAPRLWHTMSCFAGMLRQGFDLQSAARRLVRSASSSDGRRSQVVAS